MSMQRPKGLTIGRLAKGAGVGVQTIRFYERKGLLVQPPRHGPEYRQYTADHVTRIRFIQKAQGLGFSLKEIKGLMELGSTRRATCADVMKKTDRKLQEVRSKIRDLQRVQRALQQLSRACGLSKRAMAECRVLECFERGGTC